MKNSYTHSSKRSIFSLVSRFGFVGVSGFLLWQNRFAVQRLLESVGINTPWLKGNFSDAVQSGAAKVSGKIDREVNPPLTSTPRKSAAV